MNEALLTYKQTTFEDLLNTISSLESVAGGIPRGMVRSGDNSDAFDANNTQEARVMRLKGYGNAIVPQVAASFIQAFMAAQ